jgi:hypothetical protein
VELYEDPVRAIQAMLDNNNGASEYLKYHIKNIERANHYVDDPTALYSGISHDILIPACEFINCASELTITPDQLNSIMALFPIEASRLYRGFNGSIGRSGDEDRRELLNVIARYYLNAANWPRNYFRSSDLDFTNPKREDWLAALKAAYKHMHGPRD